MGWLRKLRRKLEKVDKSTFAGICASLERAYGNLRDLILIRRHCFASLKKAGKKAQTAGAVASVKRRLQDAVHGFGETEGNLRDEINRRELAVEDRQDVLLEFAKLGLEEEHPLGRNAEVGLRDMILRRA